MSATAVPGVDTSVSADQIQEAATNQVEGHVSGVMRLPAAGERIRRSIASQIFRKTAGVFQSSNQGITETSAGLGIESSSDRVISSESFNHNGEQVARQVLDTAIFPGGESTPKPVTSIAWESTQEHNQSSTQRSVHTSAELTVESSNNWMTSKRVRESGGSEMVGDFFWNSSHISLDYTDVDAFNNGELP